MKKEQEKQKVTTWQIFKDELIYGVETCLWETVDKRDTKNLALIKKIKFNSLYDKAYGCVLGALIADSCANYIQNSDFQIDQDTVFSSMKMEGGGPHDIQEGQISNNAELLLASMKSIINANEQKQGISESINQCLY